MTDLTALKYTAEHEWIALDGDTATVGITDYAADKLGDVVFVELPAVGQHVTAGDGRAARSSPRSPSASSTRRSPARSSQVNDAVVDDPSLVNADPFGDGWLVKLRSTPPPSPSCSTATPTSRSRAAPNDGRVRRASHRNGCRSPAHDARRAGLRQRRRPRAGGGAGIHPCRSRAPTSDIPPAATEAEALAELRELASQNRIARPMIGLGYYDTLTPSVIARNVLENPSWYTAYTPYQPEISQGRLEALINFQTMVTDLTGLATANASMLDESTAVVEGMLVARRASKSASNVFVVDADALPQTKALLAHRADAVGIELVELDLAHGAIAARRRTSACSCSTRAPRGSVWDPSGVVDAAHVAGALVVVGRRPPRADAAALAGLARRRRRGGHDPALRRAARLRRTPRRLHGGAPGPRAAAARTPRRRLAGCRGPPRLPSRAADARAAHPPREGDVEHLHRRRCCWPSWPRCTRSTTGPRGSRAIATDVAQEGRGARRSGCGRTACRSRRTRSSTRSASSTPGPSRRVIERARRTRLPAVLGRRRDGRRLGRRDHDRRRPRRRRLGVRAARGRVPRAGRAGRARRPVHGCRAARRRAVRRCAASRSSSRTRCSTRTGPRRR